jgi:hypothetical protein
VAQKEKVTDDQHRMLVWSNNVKKTDVHCLSYLVILHVQSLLSAGVWFYDRRPVTSQVFVTDLLLRQVFNPQ